MKERKRSFFSSFLLSNEIEIFTREKDDDFLSFCFLRENEKQLLKKKERSRCRFFLWLLLLSSFVFVLSFCCSGRRERKTNQTGFLWITVKNGEEERRKRKKGRSYTTTTC